MAWNEPGDRDPWGGRRNGGDGPPDLDEVVRKMQEKLGGLFGGGGGGGSSDGPSASLVIGAIFLIGLLWLAFQSMYIIEAAERGVVLRFGKHVATLQPGLAFRFPPPIELVETVDVDQIRPISHKSSMLTKDENIVDIEMAVQYKVKDVADYSFRVVNPDDALRQATETAVREVIGTSTMDFVLTEGRSAIQAGTKERIQDLLDTYKTGLIVDSVNMQPAKPPNQVKASFDDAIKSREDYQRLINEAEAYSNEIIPTARGAAARQTEEAIAYKEQVIAESDGETARFLQLLAVYERAPEVTRQRLYLETLESVLSKTSKVLLDVEGSNSLMYLPIGEIMKQSGMVQPSSTGRELAAPNPAPLTAQGDRDRADDRTRGSRR
jgi:membrane protease subunit HflK